MVHGELARDKGLSALLGCALIKIYERNWPFVDAIATAVDGANSLRNSIAQDRFHRDIFAARLALPTPIKAARVHDVCQSVRSITTLPRSLAVVDLGFEPGATGEGFWCVLLMSVAGRPLWLLFRTSLELLVSDPHFSLR